MLKIKLRKIGKAKNKEFSIIAIDSRKMFSKNTKLIGKLNKNHKKLTLTLQKLQTAITHGAKFSYGLIKIFKGILNNTLIKKYEIKVH
ncbi:hypothetical protein JSR02_00290 [Candidatus Vidania fulgoroideae]|uniref:Ribosomal protein S16 n=1 Tax=Candidatus Vidania fulgoroideorum TaxID=881286 RepID=A0A974XA96_9PROT|nr:hypothetical protein JSR02_00290 [Candidatus Vidania fulgoroideae]